MSRQAVSVDEKAQDVYMENAQTTTGNENVLEDKSNQLRDGLVKSRFDSLSITQALWTFRRSFAYTLLIYTAYIMDGYEVTMSGSIVANKGFEKQFGTWDEEKGKYVNNDLWVAGWGAIINVGQIITMTHISWIADRYGRKVALFVGWFYALICLIIMTVSRTPAVWLIAKMFVGMAVGVSQVIVTPYVAEIAPNRSRGAMIAVGLVWQQIGSITCSVMMNIVNKTHPMWWQLPIYIEYGMVGIMFICYVFTPETPWYYGRRGDREGAMKSMKRLYKGIEGYDYEEEYGVICRTIEHEKELLAQAKAQSWSHIFRGLNGKRMWILLVMCTGQQVGGNALIAVYSTYFFQQAGLENPFNATMIQTCMALVAIIVYVGLIDRIGRRWPVCIVYTMITVLLWMIGGLWYSKSKATQNVLLALVCIWQPCFSLYAKSYYVIASELPSAQLRVKTGSFVWFYQALWGIALTFASPPLLRVANIRAAWLFAGLSIPVCVILWLQLPETKGRSVAEMDELYERRVKAWKTRTFVTDAERQLEAYLEGERRAVA